MQDRLLNTNIISTYLNGDKPTNTKYAQVDRFLKSLGTTKVLVSSITILEIESGLAMGDRPDLPQSAIEARAEVRRFLADCEPIDPDRHTAEFYAPIRAKLFRTHGTPDGRRNKFKERKTHELCWRVSDLSIGIDERDLLIVCAALQKNLVLVTLDDQPEMTAIIAAARSLEADGVIGKLYVHDWEAANDDDGSG